MRCPGHGVKCRVPDARGRSEHHPVIFLSTHGEGVHRACIELLEAYGYQVRALDGPPVGADELVAITRFS